MQSVFRRGAMQQLQQQASRFRDSSSTAQLQAALVRVAVAAVVGPAPQHSADSSSPASSTAQCHSAASEQLNRLSQLAGPQALAVPYGGSGSAGDRSSARVRTRRPMAGAQRPR